MFHMFSSQLRLSSIVLKDRNLYRAGRIGVREMSEVSGLSN